VSPGIGGDGSWVREKLDVRLSDRAVRAEVGAEQIAYHRMRDALTAWEPWPVSATRMWRRALRGSECSPRRSSTT